MMKKILFFLLVVTTLYTPASAQTAPPFWEDIVAFKKADAATPPPAASILFVGSSSFTRWTDVQKAFPGYTIVNRGFGGSTLVDVIRYAYDVILPYKPKQVVIYCGENDLAASDTVSAAEVVARFKTLYAIIRQNLPNTTINFVSIKASPSRPQIATRLAEVNKTLKAFLKKEKKAGFIDVNTPMLDAQGRMREDLYVEDRLHMNAQGYTIWQRIIQPYLLK
jgi:lysophospholipase L1-like esterase